MADHILISPNKVNGSMELSGSFMMTSSSPRRSASRQRSLASSEDSAFFQTSVGRVYGGSMDLQQALEQSETRRLLLIEKMREAQVTIVHQAEHLNDVEQSSKEISHQVNDYKRKEKDYQRKLTSLENECKANQERQMEYLKTREDLQKKIESLGAELTTVRAAGVLLQSQCKRKDDELQHKTALAKRLQDDTDNFLKEKQAIHRELLLIRKTNQIARGRFEYLDSQLKDNKRDLERLKEENRSLLSENRALNKQLIDERSCCCGQKDEIRNLSARVHTVDTEKQRIIKQTAELHELVSDLRVSMATVVADKERYFQEKLELLQLVQSLVYEKEKIAKAKETAEEQVTELSRQLAQTKSTLDRKNEEIGQLKEELLATKRTTETLSKKLEDDKHKIDTTLQEQSQTQQTTDRFTTERFVLYDKEIKTLDQQLDITRKSMERMSREHVRSKEQLEEQVMRLKEELKLMRQERGVLDSELASSQAKLQVVDQNLKSHTDLLQGELEHWKNSHERLANLAERQEMEIQRLTTNNQELHDEMKMMKRNHDAYQTQCDELIELRERMLRFEEDTRRLVQERAENQQLIELLEMQKNVLVHLSRPSIPSSRDFAEPSIANSPVGQVSTTDQKTVALLPSHQNTAVTPSE